MEGVQEGCGPINRSHDVTRRSIRFRRRRRRFHGNFDPLLLLLWPRPRTTTLFLMPAIIIDWPENEPLEN